jgi:hypothetical protein
LRAAVEEERVEIKIGVKGALRELVLESDATPEEIAKQISAAMPAGVLTLSDSRGRQLIVPAEKLAYVEIGEPETRRVGFGAM